MKFSSTTGYMYFSELADLFYMEKYSVFLPYMSSNITKSSASESQILDSISVLRLNKESLMTKFMEKN